MAKIALGIGTSHGPQLSTPADEWGQRASGDRRNPALAYRGSDYTFEQLNALRGGAFAAECDPGVQRERHARSRAAIDELGRIIRAANVDVLVVVSSDHKELYGDELLPQFAIYWGDAMRHEPYTEAQLASMPPGLAVAEVANQPARPEVRQGHPELGLHLIGEVSRAGFDPGAAKVLPAGLHRAPGLRVLATSRQPLQLTDEHVLTVDPLPVPRPDSVLSAEMLTRYESVALLVDRATAVQPAFTVHEGNRNAVARLCARLDGLPLAIELAATRLRSLSVEQVADRLDDRFRLLNRGNAAAMPRQRTLRALMDWSYELCSEQERQLWARLSVFPGDFDLAAAEATCEGPDLPQEVIVDRLDGLVAKSVVSARPESPTARYQMLETIRQYGRELLSRDGGTRQVQRQHRDYYFRLGRECCARWCGPDQNSLLATLRLEHDNLMTALEWSLANGDEPVALELVSALRYHWSLNYPAAGRRMLEQVLNAARDPSPQRGDALWVAAWVARIQGDTEASATWRLECQEIAERFADEHLRAYVQLFAGSMALFTGDPSDAVRSLGASLVRLREQRDMPMILMGLFLYSLALNHSGDSPAAQAACAEAISLAEERGELWARAMATLHRGFDLWRNGDPEGNAAELARESLRLAPDANAASTVLSIELLAWIEGSHGEHERAARLLGAAAAQWESQGVPIDNAFPLFARYSNHCRATALDALGEARFGGHFEYGKTHPAQALSSPGTASAPTGKTEEDLPLLTPREREVAELIAKGYTNKAIAAELVLSPHTVGGHVERLFNKLGISARAQVAAWLVQLQDQAALRAHKPV